MESEKFCGRDIDAKTSRFVPKSVQWSSKVMLKGLQRKDIIVNQSYLSRKKDFFLHAAYTEYDAENLCKYLDTLEMEFSPEFKVFEKVWRRDEWNHYVGFRYIYSIMFNQREEDVARLIEERPSNFSGINQFLNDEFSICLLIAFDEILTTKGYAGEKKLYHSLGHPAFARWFKYVTKDEAYHFTNAMEVIRLNHYNRIPEIPKMLDSFIEWDMQRNEYGSTFVLDHDLYSPEFIQEGANVIKKYFQLRT